MSTLCLPLSGANSRLLAPSRFPAFHLKCPAFLRISRWKMPFMRRSAQRQVEHRRLGNQLPVLGKANSLYNVGNISLQPGTSMILKLCRPLFCNTISSFDRVMYRLVKCWVFCLLFCQLRPLVVGKILTPVFYAFSSALSHFFVR